MKERLDVLLVNRGLAQSREKAKAIIMSGNVFVKGMREAVLNGTCRAANIPGLEVCGKTGTAENRGQDHSVFMGFAPMKNPKIAVAVYVENGGFGAEYGVPIGALIMEQYLNGKLSEASAEKAKAMEKRTIYYGTDER